jgi:group I intron endonuclease
MNKSGIYKIENPKGSIYIGQSKNIDERLSRYKKLQCCKFQLLLYRSFLKYGIENHTFEVLEKGEFTKEDLNKLEKEYIVKYNSYRKLNKKGLNLTTGGDSVEFDDSIKKKMSDKRIELFKAGQRNSKLTLENVIEIKKLIAYNTPLRKIAETYGVGITTISEIKSGRSWNDVLNYIISENEKHLVNRTNQFSRLQKLTEQQRLEVLNLIDKKELTFEQIGKLYNVTKGAVSAIKRSKIKFGK